MVKSKTEFLEALSSPPIYQPRVIVRNSGAEYFFDYDEIVSIEAANTQVTIHTLPETVHEPRIVICKTLKAMEQLLPTVHFLRVHKSWIVNLKYVRCHKKGDSHHLLLMNKQRVPISRSLIRVVSAALGGL